MRQTIIVTHEGENSPELGERREGFIEELQSKLRLKTG